MKAYIVLIIVLFSGQQSWSESLLVNTYSVISDVYADSIPDGKCLIKGSVYMAYSESPVNKGYVSDLYRMKQGLIAGDGTYQFLMDAKTTKIFFYSPSHGEILTSELIFQNKHCITIDFITGEESIAPIMVEKPVIYLYNHKELDVHLSLKPMGPMVFSYPLYEEGWKVKVKGKGVLEVKDKLYPYLFWEGEYANLDFVIKNGGVEGNYIKTDSTVLFLQNVLTKIGFNSNEMTDFITYWAPRMMQYNFVTVQFLVGEDYARLIAELKSNPKPDSELRVFMLFQGFKYDASPNFLVEPFFEPFNRKGFSLVEWGGAEL